MQKVLFFKFTATLSLYYISYSIIMGFAALFLQYKGFSNTQIGIFFASSAILCVALQLFSGSFLDRHPSISAKACIFVSHLLVTCAVIVLLFAKYQLMILFCYIIIGALMLANASFFNSYGMEYINSQIPLNYALTRGIGSFFFAVSVLAMGFVIKSFSIMSIFVAFFVAESLFFLSLFAIRPVRRDSVQKVEQEKDNFILFFRRNPTILFLLLSILLVYTSYTSMTNFHINVITSVGGGSREMGISVSLASLLGLPAMAIFQPVSKKFSYRGLVCFSCTFFFLQIFSLLFAENIWGVYFSQCLQFFSYGLFIPASTYYLNTILTDNDKAKGQSALGIFTFGLGGLFSSLLGGILLDAFPVKTLIAVECCIAFIGLVGVYWSCHRLRIK